MPSFIKFIGPSLDYIIDAVAKDLDGREGDKVDMETVTNATSVQIQVSNGINKLFLTGDCAPLAIPESENLKKYAYIQLPHHGKADSAKALFDRTYPENGIVFFVSDNTGNSNGGSDKLDTTGHNVKNTKQRGTLLFTLDVSSNRYVGSLG